jgi:hypothetical protein
MMFIGSNGLYAWGFADSAGFTLARSGSVPAAVGSPAGGAALHLSIAPNPSPSESFVAFTMPQAGPARLEVLDIGGRRVALLADGMQAAGAHEVRWSARQAGVAPGMYFVRLVTGSGSAFGKLVAFAR